MLSASGTMVDSKDCDELNIGFGGIRKALSSPQSRENLIPLGISHPGEN